MTADIFHWVTLTTTASPTRTRTVLARLHIPVENCPKALVTAPPPKVKESIEVRGSDSPEFPSSMMVVTVSAVTNRGVPVKMM